MKRRMPSARHRDRRKDLPYSINNHGRVILLPASELTRMTTWERRAKALRRAELVVVQANSPRLEKVVQRIKVTMSKYGRPVIITKVH